MSGQDLMAEMNFKRRLLNDALKEHRQRGENLAQKERDYRVADAKFTVRERANGTPVTIIDKLSKGDEAIAFLRQERDIADVLYDNSREAIMVYKKEIDILNDQIKREWGKAE